MVGLNVLAAATRNSATLRERNGGNIKAGLAMFANRIRNRNAALITTPQPVKFTSVGFVILAIVLRVAFRVCPISPPCLRPLDLRVSGVPRPVPCTLPLEVGRPLRPQVSPCGLWVGGVFLPLAGKAAIRASHPIPHAGIGGGLHPVHPPATPAARPCRGQQINQYPPPGLRIAHHHNPPPTASQAK